MIRNLTIKTICFLAAFTLPLQPPCRAQDGGGTFAVRLLFERTSSSPDLPLPEAGRRALEALLASSVVDSVLVEGWASPDGPAARNAALSQERAAAAIALLRELGLPQDVPVRAKGGGEDWNSVKQYIRAAALPAGLRDGILSLIAWEEDPDRREWLLRERYPETWASVREASYGDSRCAEATLWYHTPAKDVSAVDTVTVKGESSVRADMPVGSLAGMVCGILRDYPSVVAAMQPKDGLSVKEEPAMVSQGAKEGMSQEEEAIFYSRSWRVSPRMNLVLPLLNVGLEVACGPKGRLVVGADWYYPWTRGIGNGSWCVEAQAAGLDLRWYFRDGRNPYRRATGFWMGLSAMAAYYDLCLHREGVQGEALAGGLSLGWTFPVNRGRWRMGLEATFGYAYLQNRRYDVFDGTAFREGDFMRTVSWWGPVKAAWTLEIPIWHNVRR